MVFSFLSYKSKIGNFVIEDHVIRYVEVKQANTLVAAKQHERYLPEGIIKEGRIIDKETLIMILEECVSDWGLNKVKVRFTVPNAVVVIRPQKLEEPLKDEEIRGHLFMEIGASIHLPFEDALFDFVVTNRNESKTDIILFAAPEQLVLDYMDAFREAKLKPIAADVSPLALYRLCFNGDRVHPDEHQMLVQFDLFSVNVSIFHQHRPLFTRHIIMNGSMDEWIMQHNQAEGAQFEHVNGKEDCLNRLIETYTEIKRIVDFYRFSLYGEEHKIRNVLLAGDHPYLSEIAAGMQEELSLSVELLNVEAGQKNLAARVPLKYYLALGLGLKEVH